MKLARALLAALFAATGLSSFPSYAVAEESTPPVAEQAIGDDGREVRLYPDGRWEFISDDRFATTLEGRRVRLTTDGRWFPVTREEATRYGLTQKGGFSQDVAESENFSARLVLVDIETARSARQKNRTERSQMIFRLEVHSLPSLGKLDLDTAGFRVSDSRGREYTVTQVSPPAFTPTPGEPVPLAIFVADSPQWWGIKFFVLEIQPNALGNDTAIRLTKVMGEVTHREVSELSGSR